MNINKLSEVKEVLRKVINHIDPNAFIAGGLPASLYLNKNWNSDTDIFFSSPNFNFDAWGIPAYFQIKALFPECKVADTEIYWYNKRFVRVATFKDIDFIQVNYDPELKVGMEDYVFNKFDINLCKIAMRIDSRSNVYFYPSDEFIKGVEDKRLVYELGLSDHKYESEVQDGITKIRLEKYKERFPNFKVKELK